MSTHLFTYHYEGEAYNLEIDADSAEEAKIKLRNASYATYDGEVHASGALVPEFLVRLWQFIWGARR